MGGEGEGSVREKRDERDDETVDERGLVSDFLQTSGSAATKPRLTRRRIMRKGGEQRAAASTSRIWRRKTNKKELRRS
jgi:hypothetical protein